jgi:uncharacterized membrane protein
MGAFPFRFIIQRMQRTGKGSHSGHKSRAVGLLVIVAVLLWVWLANTPDGILGKADATAYAVCHRIESHSFQIGERTFPLCIRCSGMYLGAILGLAYMAIIHPRRGGIPKTWVLVVLGVFASAFAFDGVNSFLNLINEDLSFYPPQHLIRLLTGMGMGLVISVMVFVGVNQTAWKYWDARPVLDSGRFVAGLIALALLLSALVWTQNPSILYPLAFISAAGVWVVLTLVYMMLWLMIFRQENQRTGVRQFFIPLLAGFGSALIQIMLFDLVRFALTGTWGGFHFG